MCGLKQGVRTVASVHVQSIAGWKQHQKGQKTARPSGWGSREHTGRPTGQEQPQGVKTSKENDVRIVIQSVQRREEAGNQKRRGHFSGEERAWWCSRRMAAKEGRVQRPLSDERAEHASGQKQASEAEAQHLRILNTWIWKRRWAHFMKGHIMKLHEEFEYTLRVNTWGRARRRITWSNVCFPVLHTKACPAFLSNIQCQSQEKLILKVRGKNSNSNNGIGGGRKQKNTIDKTISK